MIDAKEMTPRIAIGTTGSGSECSSIILWVGIIVSITDWQWGLLVSGWYPDDMRLASPSEFPISVEDQMKATVHRPTANSAVFVLTNLVTGKVWEDSVTGPPMECKQDAEWVIATAPGDDMPLANFNTVTFTDISVQTSGTDTVPNAPKIHKLEIVEVGRLPSSTAPAWAISS
ncbi:hypothetical protein L210DRAFT_1018937 [Boletus edulis BED1]|uniref:Uncharacterized protein n=1 Tax=Boletus edulis BED1 TaxID=1328754 RepID=A0AAD4GLH4_BOLED|nr:hypothetical protein L210DRAFT_1018937 [Boletus edulis BED1]